VVKVTSTPAPAPLAYTGSTSTDLLLPALGLLTLGGLLVAVSRRTRRA
jgi:LPXTG-motif cell wall-anchored protein